MLQFKEYLKEYLAVSTSEYVFDPNGYGNENGRNMEKTWTGTFPEGTMISGFRCVDPNTSARGAEEHSASCVCADGVCDWDRQLPVCTTHGQNHSGYS